MYLNYSDPHDLRSTEFYRCCKSSSCSPFGPIKNAFRMPPKIGRSAALSTPPRKFVIPAAFKSAMAASMSLTSIAMCGKRPPSIVTSVPSCGDLDVVSSKRLLDISLSSDLSTETFVEFYGCFKILCEKRDMRKSCDVFHDKNPFRVPAQQISR